MDGLHLERFEPTPERVPLPEAERRAKELGWKVKTPRSVDWLTRKYFVADDDGFTDHKGRISAVAMLKGSGGKPVEFKRTMKPGRRESIHSVQQDLKAWLTRESDERPWLTLATEDFPRPRISMYIAVNEHDVTDHLLDTLSAAEEFLTTRPFRPE